MTVSFARACAGLEDLIDPDAELRKLGEGFRFTEGPVWNKAEHSLLFSDIQTDARWRWSEERGMEVVMRPNFIANGLVYDARGDLLLCEHVTSSVVAVRPNGDRRLCAFHYRGKYLNSPNDVVTRSDGSVYFSDPDYGRWEHAVGVARKRDLDFHGVYRVPPGEQEIQLVVKEDEFDQPNGLCFSPDEAVLYVNDLHGIKAYDVAPDGSLANCRIFNNEMTEPGAEGEGAPDGMKCDARGNVWCAGRGGVWIISPSGDVLGILETSEIVANLAWGGDDWRSLFLCTSTTVHVIPTRVASATLPYH